MVDLDDWKSKKMKEKAEFEAKDTLEDIGTEDEESIEREEIAGLEMDKSSRRMESKRKVEPKIVKPSKRLKLDLVTGWGEAKEGLEEKPDIRSWLVESSSPEKDATGRETSDIPNIEPNKKLKQMELNFVKLFTEKAQGRHPTTSIHQEDIPHFPTLHKEGIPSAKNEDKQNVGTDSVINNQDTTSKTTRRKTGKLTKREIKELSATHHNISNWVKKAVVNKAKDKQEEDVEEMEVEAEMETETIPDIARMARVRKARAMETHWLNIRAMESLIVDIVMETEARSAASNILEEIIDEGVWDGRMNILWREIVEDRKARMEMVRRLHSHELDCQKKERLKKVKEKQTIVPKSLKSVNTDDDGDDKEVYKEVEKLENLIDLEEKLCCWSLKENAEHMEIDDLITSTGAGQEEMEVELMEEDAHEELDAIIRLMNDTWEEATYQEIKVAECRITKQETIEESMDTTTRDTDMVEEEDGVKYEEWVLKELRVMGLDLMASYYNKKDAYNRDGNWIVDRWVDTNRPPAVIKSHGKNERFQSVCSVCTNWTDMVCSNTGEN
jgi:hypothetical protein